MANAEHAQTIAPVVCTACGCLCDDIEILAGNGQIHRADNACELGRRWFLAARDDRPPVARFRGLPVTLSDAFDRIARMLAAARCPLVHGLSALTCEAQALAVELAQHIRGVIDCDAHVHAPVQAAKYHGLRKCSLGDLRHRADLVVIWRADPAVTHPRHFERYSAEPVGMWLPRGRPDRTIIVIGENNQTAARADQFLAVPPGSSHAFLLLLAARLRGVSVASATYRRVQIEEKEAEALLIRLKACRYGVWLFDATTCDADEVDPMAALVARLDRETRFALLSLGEAGNGQGAFDTIASRTGLPPPVSFLDGSARHGIEFRAESMLDRREPDVYLTIGAQSRSTDPIGGNKGRSMVRFVIGHQPGADKESAEIAVVTAAPGISTEGTVHRIDDVPLPLSAILPDSYPTDEQVLRELLTRLRNHE